MTKDIWLNLPVKDVKKSKEFFTKLGFSFDTKYGNTAVSAGMVVGEKRFIVMLFEETAFKGFAQHKITDTKEAVEVLISIDAASREEVDQMAKKAADAGGTVFAKPSESQGWLYGCAFTDLDGHRWNVLYMDMAKMPR